jgi:hypothetical protein
MSHKDHGRKSISIFAFAVFTLLALAALTGSVALAGLPSQQLNSPPHQTGKFDTQPNDTGSAGRPYSGPPSSPNITCTQSFTGSITAADPVQTGRVFRDGISDSCGVADDVCSVGVTTGARHYDIYTFTAQANTCVTVDLNALACIAANFLYSAAYIGPFNPANLCTNYVASSGDSPNTTIAYSFEVGAGQTFSVVVHELNPDAGCSQYNISISGNICSAPTPTITPTRTATPTPASCGPNSNYAAVTGVATMFPGITNIVSFCDDCVVSVTLPFPFTLYDQTFNQVDLDSNGKAHFPTGAAVFTNTCLPQAGATYTIFPYWDDQRTDVNTCPGGCGIFTSVSGTAPNRIFNIEWRTAYFAGGGNAHYELQLYEAAPSRFEIIYGALSQGNTSATSGVQRDGGAFTQHFCNGAGGPFTGSVSYTQPPCPGTATPTRTPTRTPTPSVPSMLVGHVVWQGRPTTAASLGQVMPLTLTLKLGNNETNYPPTIPPYIDTDASGFFTVSVSTLPAGTYNWRLKGPSYLSTRGTLVLGAGLTQAEMGLQLGGDISGDNLVTISDFNTVKTNFGTGGAPPINPDLDMRK